MDNLPEAGALPSVVFGMAPPMLIRCRGAANRLDELADADERVLFNPLAALFDSPVSSLDVIFDKSGLLRDTADTTGF